MLDAIGVKSIDDLFADIPEGVRLGRELNIPAGMAEFEVFDKLSALADKNIHADREVSFLGAGMYDHYVPSLVDSILSRSEFLTPYTPYQPEVCQGGLQAMFEYQTASRSSRASMSPTPRCTKAQARWLQPVTWRTSTTAKTNSSSPRGQSAIPRDAQDERLRIWRRGS